MRERFPRDLDWQEVPTSPEVLRLSSVSSTWMRGRLLVISSLELEAREGPTWHISISSNGRRPIPREVRRALMAFGLLGAEEDNHHPGRARHFWMPVDPARRGKACACKRNEDLIEEPDGFTWTNPKDGSCRGCELESMIGAPCTLHGERVSP